MGEPADRADRADRGATPDMADRAARGATPGMLEAVADFVDLVDRLRRECPWDAEQTHTSLRPHLLEEAHEVLEALDNLDEVTGEGIGHVCEELGDLLFQVVFHARIAAESGRFDLGDVARGIHDKLHHRHPHVFGGVGQASGEVHTEQVLDTWDRIKREEKGRGSVLDGIPATLPALARAAKTVRRAASLDMALRLTAPPTRRNWVRRFSTWWPGRAGRASTRRRRCGAPYRGSPTGSGRQRRAEQPDAAQTRPRRGPDAVQTLRARSSWLIRAQCPHMDRDLPVTWPKQVEARVPKRGP